MLQKLKDGSQLFIKNVPIANRPVVVVDVDDVLYPCGEILTDHFNELCEKDIPFERCTMPIALQYPELGLDTREDFNKHLINVATSYMDHKPFEYAAALCQMLQDSGYYVAVTTHRGFHPLGYLHTHKMLVENQVPFDCIACVANSSSKFDFISDNVSPSIELVLEDNPTVLYDFADARCTTICFDRPWNSKVLCDLRVSCDSSCVDAIKDFLKVTA